MCEVRIIRNKENQIRVDVAGYQKQVKTVASHSDLWRDDARQFEVAEMVEIDWLRYSGLRRRASRRDQADEGGLSNEPDQARLANRIDHQRCDRARHQSDSEYASFPDFRLGYLCQPKSAARHSLHGDFDRAQLLHSPLV